MNTAIARLSPNLQGSLFMCVAMAGFSCNDAMIKLVSQDIDLYQAIFLRGVLVTAAFGAIALATGAFRPVRGRSDRRALIGRSLGEILGGFCFLTALTRMPMANATAILQSMPLAITLGAAYLLHEPVGRRRYIAIAVGFAGVLIIVRPGSAGFNAHSLLVVAAVFLFTLRDLSTRLISPDVSTAMAAFITSAATTAAAGLVSLVVGWQPISAFNLLTLCFGSGCLMIGYHYSIVAIRTGEVSFTAPFRYSLLLWAMLFGYAIYGDLPDAFMTLGAGVVIGAGIYSFHIERQMSRG